MNSKNNELPEEIKTYVEPYKIKNNSNILILSDTHIKFQNNKAIDLAIEYSKFNYKIDVVLLLGDILDMYAVSKYAKEQKMPELQKEINATKQFLKYIRLNFAKQQIIYVQGNHEERIEKFLMSKATELSSLDCLQLNELLDFKKFKIDYINHKRLLKYHDFIISHGHEFSGVSGEDSTKKLLNKYNSNLIHCHLHKTNEFFKINPFDNTLLRAYSVGCLCDIKQNYLPYSNWNLGFCVVYFKNGYVQVDNKRIYNNKIF